MAPLLLGNDIVDLKAIEPPLHPRYRDRVCTPTESELIGNDSTELWLHWAAKEAAFKALRRWQPEIQFIPRLFQFDPTYCTVRWGETLLQCQIDRSADYVHVVCAPNLSDTHYWIEAVSPEGKVQASNAVRELFRREVSSLVGIAPHALSIVRSDGIPAVSIDGIAQSIPVSFSHHGRFVACAVTYPLRVLGESRIQRATNDNYEGEEAGTFS